MATVTTNQRGEKFEQLVELSSQLNGPVELEPFLQSVVNVACEVINCQAGSIFLYEERPNCSSLWRRRTHTWNVYDASACH